MYYAIRLHLLRGEAPKAAELAEAALAPSIKHEAEFRTAMILFLQGWLQCLQGRATDGTALMRAGF